MKLVPIPAGEFLMGSPDSDPDAASDERPQHRVRITRPSYLGTCEVTRAQYRGVMGETPGGFEDQPDHPAEGVSWDDAVRFCNALSRREGLKPFYAIEGQTVSVPDWGVPGYRLPTEAEWEYACRAGSWARYGFGEDTANLDEYAWCGAHSGGKSHTVARKLPNDFGLFDMHGNVWEYCWDGFDAAYYTHSPVDDPLGPPQARYRVIRGGSWASEAGACLPGVRRRTLPAERNGIQGFRVARSMTGR
jgi:formylglycine-generating enzyme required for sulfatase activity